MFTLAKKRKHGAIPMPNTYSQNQSKPIMKMLSLSRTIALLVACGCFLLSEAQVSYTQNWTTNNMNGWTSTDNGSFNRSTTRRCGSSGYTLRGNVWDGTAEAVNSPLLGSSNGGLVTLSFNYKILLYNVSTATPAANAGTISVQYASSASGPWSVAYEINPANHTATTSCTNKTITFTPATGSLYIRFLVLTVQGIDNDYYFDDVVVSQGAAPSCISPTGLTAGSLTRTGATISWTAPATPPGVGYDYYLNTSNATSPVKATVPTGSVGANATNIVLTGLQTTKDYYYWVRKICSTTDTSAWSAIGSFHTGYCSVITDYNGAFMARVKTTDGVGDVNINYAGPRNPDYYLDRTAIDSINQYAGGTVKMSIDFTPFGSVTSLSEYVGIWVDWNNDMDFDDAGEKVYGATTGVRSFNGSFSIPAGTPLGSYVMRVRSRYGDVSIACGRTYAGDTRDFNLRVMAAPTCAAPTNVKTTAVTDATATISWTTPAQAPGNGYQYYVSTSDSLIGSNTLPTGAVAAGTTNVDLTGLLASTTYYYFVRSICSGTDSSNWASGGSFNTGYCGVSYGYQSGYMSFGTTGGITNINRNVNTAPVYRDLTATDSISYYGNTPISLSFEAGFAGIAIWVDWNNDKDFSDEGETIYTSNSYGGTSGTITIPTSTLPGAYRMRVRSDGGQLNPIACGHSGSSGVTLDFTYCVLPTPTCSRPTGLSMGNITATTSTATFTSTGNSFVVEYGAPGFVPGTGATAGTGGAVVTGTSSPLSITGLTQSTTYDVYVRQNCSGSGNGYGYNSIKATVTTPCQTVTLPQANGLNSGTLPTCWTTEVVTDGSSQTNEPPTLTYQTSTNVFQPAEGSGFFLFNSSYADNNDKIRLRAVPLNTTGVTSAEVQFKWGMFKGSYTSNDRVQPQYSLDGTTWVNMGSSISRYSTTIPDGWVDQFVSLPGAALNKSLVYIGFLFTAARGEDCVIDDIRIVKAPVCARPTAATVTVLDGTKATVAFTSTANSFIIEYGPKGFTPDTTLTAGSNGTVVVASASPYTLTGLLPDTTYDVYVRANCGTERSYNSAKMSFVTPCLTTSLPIYEGLNVATWALDCWTTKEVQATAYSVGGQLPTLSLVSSSTYPTGFTPVEGTGFYALNCKWGWGDDKIRLQSPPFKTTNLFDGKVNFKWTQDANSQPDKVQVQYSLNGTTWTDIGSSIPRYSATVTGWTQQSVVLPAAALNQPIVYIGFFFTMYNGNDCHIDDIQLLGTNTWTGTVSNRWKDSANWSNRTVPNGSTDNVLIPFTGNQPRIDSATYAVNSIKLLASATLTIDSTGGLKVAGTITDTLQINASAGTIELNGTAAQNLADSIFVGDSVRNLIVNNTAGVILTGKLNLTGMLTPTAGTLTTNGYLVLKSSSTGTAKIAQGMGNYISGSVTQERYISSKAARTYSFVASPFPQSITASWQQQVHITGAGTGGTVCPSLTSNSNGFDATFTNAANMFVYDGTKAVNTRWTSVASTSVNLTAGTGYRMNIRGPRSIGCGLLDGSISSVSAATLSSSGILSAANKNMGSFNIVIPNNGNATVANDNYLLIGNPYPSEISFAQLLSDNATLINNSYVIYAPGNTIGNYAYWNGTSFTGGNTGLDDSKGDIIANGQAIFVQGKIAGADINLAFNETQKTAAANNGYFRNQQNPNRIRIGYWVNDSSKADEILLQFAKHGTIENLNPSDIVSINSGSQYIKSIKGSWQLAVNTLPLDFVSDTIDLQIKSSATGSFKLQFSDMEQLNATVFLLDRFSNTVQPITTHNAEYAFTVNTTVAATQGSNRFALVFKKNLLNTAPAFSSIKVYPNPVKDVLQVQLPTIATYVLRLSTVEGKLLSVKQNVNGNIHWDMSSLALGLYFLEIEDAKGSKKTMKIMKQ
jgi:hypothetical protein